MIKMVFFLGDFMYFKINNVLGEQQIAFQASHKIVICAHLHGV